MSHEPCGAHAVRGERIYARDSHKRQITTDVKVHHDCHLLAGHVGPHRCGDCRYTWDQPGTRR